MKKQMFPVNTMRPLAIAVALASGALMGPAVQAQDRARGSQALLEEVVVTARKREEGAQEVPLSVTAFNSDQLSALKVRSLTSLKVGMPNVALEDIGTSRGYANFAIRGLGINSSIISIDPTVGVFVNDVYLGINGGIIMDVFDLESIEVLRGPQGTLFGRNVTGGAVLMNTQKPGDELEGTAFYGIETGNDGGINSYYKAAIGGPVTDTLGARLVLYYNDDDGQFENDFTGDDFGEIEQKMARGTVTWAPTDTTDIALMYEYSDINGDGPPAQSHTNGSGVPGSPVNNDRDKFNFSIDEEGKQDNETNFVTLRIDQGVSFGDGTVTAIYGYRDFDAETYGDIDAQPRWVFHAGSWTEATQNSFELRYNGVFADKWNVTVGGLYFDNDIDYHERRDLGGFLLGGAAPFGVFDGGGEYEVETYTAFASVDYDLTDQWTLSAGVNYSSEDKDVKIVSLSQNFVTGPGSAPICNVVDGPACAFDFVDDDSWDNWAPKLGATYHIDDQQRIYGHWTRGYRSGGYNLRNTSFDPADTPGPFDEEQVDSYELGYKSSHSWGRLNAAVFYTEVDDQQREINLPGPIGTIQLVRNTADTTLWGVEVDATVSLTDGLLLLASAGYVDSSYDSVSLDLNGDGVVDGADEDLDLPRAPEWSYSVGLTYDMDIGTWGYVTSRVNYSYRDDMAYTDNNLGFIDDLSMLDASIDFNSNDGHWIFSIYGKNLLDEANHGGDTQLPDAIFGIPTGGTFSPLTPGIRYGAEVTYNF